jgi:hypothetical protein
MLKKKLSLGGEGPGIAGLFAFGEPPRAGIPVVVILDPAWPGQ